MVTRVALLTHPSSTFILTVLSALCYHCSRDLCLDHLTQHAQVVEALVRSCLDDQFSILTDVATRLQSLTISSHVLAEPLLKLEQWRSDAYQQIDDVFQTKLEEVRIQIEKYRLIFDTMRNEQLEKVNRYKAKIGALFRRTQVSNKDLSKLHRSIEQIQNDMNVFDLHSIDVISTRPLLHSIQVRMKLNDWKPSSVSPSSSSSSSSSLSSIVRQLEFRLKYVPLSGHVSSHYLLVEVNGTVQDLIDQFITKQGSLLSLHDKRFRLLATEVSQHRIRQRFTNDVRLKSIFNQIDTLVLYETPFALTADNLQHSCLILCRFQDGLPWDIQFGLPILLALPRFRCRARDVIDRLDGTLKTYFPLIATNTDLHYEVRLISDEQQIGTSLVLNEWVDQVIDEHLLIADSVTLVVNLLDSSQAPIKEPTTHLARLDDTLKSTERRRRSRK